MGFREDYLKEKEAYLVGFENAVESIEKSNMDDFNKTICLGAIKHLRKTYSRSVYSLKPEELLDWAIDDIVPESDYHKEQLYYLIASAIMADANLDSHLALDYAIKAKACHNGFVSSSMYNEMLNFLFMQIYKSLGDEDHLYQCVKEELDLTENDGELFADHYIMLFEQMRGTKYESIVKEIIADHAQDYLDSLDYINGEYYYKGEVGRLFYELEYDVDAEELLEDSIAENEYLLDGEYEEGDAELLLLSYRVLVLVKHRLNRPKEEIDALIEKADKLDKYLEKYAKRYDEDRYKY